MVTGIMINQSLIVHLLLKIMMSPIEELWNKQYPLKPFLAPENFKSYDELKSET